MGTNKKTWIPAFSVFGFFLMLVLVQLIFSHKAVQTFRENYRLQEEPSPRMGWDTPEVNRIKKDILWYEQLLTLSKSDSMYLAVNLQENIVQLKLRGMYLAEAKILLQYPDNFLGAADEKIYTHFATLSPIINETANFPKKPLRKVVAYSSAIEPWEAKRDTAVKKPLCWTFLTESNLRVIIYGVETASDSSLNFHPKQDILWYRMQDIIREPLCVQYLPTLYLWLCDKEAMSIFRAVPPGGKLLFRN